MPQDADLSDAIGSQMTLIYWPLRREGRLTGPSIGGDKPHAPDAPA
jgi:hypothetical protein